MILGVGNPSALHVKLTFWFSRIATLDGVLRLSIMLGGTEKEITNLHKIVYVKFCAETTIYMKI